VTCFWTADYDQFRKCLSSLKLIKKENGLCLEWLSGLNIKHVRISEPQDSQFTV
jgi:hypothetical protein